MNETPKNALVAAPVNAEEVRRVWNAQRLEDLINQHDAGKALQIVVQGKCKVCKRRSGTVPATKTQAMAWFTEKETKGFKVYEVRMLETGVHRKCQTVQDKKAKARPHRKNNDVHAVPMDGDKVARIMGRRAARRA